MKKALLPLAIMMFTTISYADVFQCANGEFRDTPCPNSNGNKVDVYNPALNDSSTNSNGGDFSYEKFSKAIAKIEITRSLAYKCKNELSFNNNDNLCQQLNTETAQYSDFEKSMDIIKEYSKNKEFHDKNWAEFNSAFSNYKDIYNIKTYVDEFKNKQ